MMTVAGYAATVDAPTGDPEDIARAQQDFGSSLYTVRCSREALMSQRDKVPGLANKGVYVLVGGLTAAGTRRIYIGHARELGKRFESHLRKKNFWTHCIFITSTHNVLHEGHIERVEALLIAQAKALPALDSSENSVTPSDRSATNDVERAAVTIIREFQLHLSTLGMNYARWLVPKESPPLAPALPRFWIKARGIVASAIRHSGQLTVEAGSEMAATETNSLQKTARRQRQEMQRDGTVTWKHDRWVFQCDVEFDSSSGASQAVLGRSSSGPDDWKADSGESLKEFCARQDGR